MMPSSHLWLSSTSCITCLSRNSCMSIQVCTSVRTRPYTYAFPKYFSHELAEVFEWKNSLLLT
jgi:hypothetical protein